MLRVRVYLPSPVRLEVSGSEIDTSPETPAEHEIKQAHPQAYKAYKLYDLRLPEEVLDFTGSEASPASTTFRNVS